VKINTQLSVDDHDICPSSQATHVGLVRCSDGNGPHISGRLTDHRRAVYAVLHAGLEKGHRANAAPVLLSGLASLVLTSKEEKILDKYYKVHLQRLLRLHQATPTPVVFFLAGCLPLQAQLHLRIISLFGQLF